MRANCGGRVVERMIGGIWRLYCAAADRSLSYCDSAFENATGELKDPAARQLVEAINKWCPAAARAAASANRMERILMEQNGRQRSEQAQ
jgi:hypothetical protein